MKIVDGFVFLVKSTSITSDMLLNPEFITWMCGKIRSLFQVLGPLNHPERHSHFETDLPATPCLAGWSTAPSRCGCCRSCDTDLGQISQKIAPATRSQRYNLIGATFPMLESRSSDNLLTPTQINRVRKSVASHPRL